MNRILSLTILYVLVPVLGGIFFSNVLVSAHILENFNTVYPIFISTLKSANTIFNVSLLIGMIQTMVTMEIGLFFYKYIYRGIMGKDSPV